MTDAELTRVTELAKEVMAKTSDPQHGWGHLERVRRNALKITEILNLKKEIDMNLLQAACLLHDLPIALFNPPFLKPIIKHLFEEAAVKKYLPGILEKLTLQKNEADILYNAILKHNFTIPYRILNKNGDIYAKVMQDADSLDYFSDERKKVIVESKDPGLFYKLGKIIADRYFRYGRENMGSFLNFPNLAPYFYK